MARLSSWICKTETNHWFVSWLLFALSGIWYSLILTYLGKDWNLIIITANGNRKLSWIGWISTIVLLIITSAIKFASQYHATHNEYEELLEDEQAAADLYYRICSGKSKVNSIQETSYIARIEELTNKSDDVSAVNYNPCSQIERITEELRTTLMKTVSDRGARFNNDLYVGVAYNLPLENAQKWHWCKNTCEKGLCIDDAMSPNSSFHQLIKDEKCGRRVFYNSKDQAYKKKLYIPDAEDVIDSKTGKLQGSIACYSIDLKKNDISFIKIAIGISSFRNMFVKEDSLTPGWENEDLNNCPFIANVDFIVEQYAALLRIELCKFYINKLSTNKVNV